MIFGLLFTAVSAIPHQHGKGAAPQRSEPIYSCQPGLNLVGKKCVREFNEPAMAYCPLGFQQRGNGKDLTCVKTAAKVGNCPMGSLNAGKGCLMTEKTAYLESCPAGYQSTGKQCSRTIPLPMVTKCPVGTLAGKECISIETAPYVSEVYCPAGYIQTGKGCERSSTYDCTPAQPSKKGGYGGHGGHGHLRFLGHKDKKHHGYTTTSKKAVPAPKIAVVQKTCTKTEFSKPISKKYCPAGFIEAGKGCEKKIVTAPIQVCSNGYGSGKDCSTQEFAPPQRLCPAGYQMSGKQCLRQVDVPKEYSCPMGFFDNGKECEKAVASAIKCVNHGLELRGDQCYGRVMEEPIVTYQVTCVGKDCANH